MTNKQSKEDDHKKQSETKLSLAEFVGKATEQQKCFGYEVPSLRLDHFPTSDHPGTIG